MDRILLWIATVLTTLYGVLTALAGLGQIRAKKIQAAAAWGLVLSGLVVVTAAVLSLLRSGAALTVLSIGLVGIHALAINNGYKMFGKINPSHHLARLVLSITLLILTYLGMK